MSTAERVSDGAVQAELTETAVGQRWAPACGLCGFVGRARFRTPDHALNRSLQHVLVVHKEQRALVGWTTSPASSTLDQDGRRRRGRANVEEPLFDPPGHG